mgnify:CR=1 FL=1
MKRRFSRIGLWLAVLMVTPLASFAKNRYQSDLLIQMAESLQMKAELDTISNGSYIAQKSYNSHPLSIIVENGEVEHIGYTIFSKEMRTSMSSPVCNFLERLGLQADLPLKRIKTVNDQLTEDEVNFTVGNIHMLASLWGVDNLNFSLYNAQDKMCRATWTKNGKPYCSLSFPVSYNLYHGTDLVENQRRLKEDLLRVSNVKKNKEKGFSKEQLTKWFEPNYFVLKGDSLYVASLNSNNYYVQDDNDHYKLLFSDRHPIESFANLLTTNSIDNNIQASIKLVMYDFKSEMINIPLANMLHYFMTKGCKAYFGMIDRKTNQYTAELLMLKRDEGYCHTIKLTFNTNNVSSRSGTISGRMNCYIPISKVKFLFDEKKK